jgi:hypothetical protein
LGEVKGEFEVMSLRPRSWARSVRVRPPRIAKARSARSKAAQGFGMGIRFEGRVFGFEGVVRCNLGAVPRKWHGGKREAKIFAAI